jgi:hypothetical protein
MTTPPTLVPSGRPRVSALTRRSVPLEETVPVAGVTLIHGFVETAENDCPASSFARGIV